MSYSPDTGLVYIPVLDFPASYGQPEHFVYRPGAANTGTDGIIGSLPDDQAVRDALRPLIKGRLLAWDPRTQREAFRVEHSGAWNGGMLTTAGGLLFQGTADGRLVAFDAGNGKALWSFPTQTGVVAPAITYQIDGEQYVSVNAGWGGAFALVFGEFVQAASLPNVSRVLTFKLGADGRLPPVDWRPAVAFNPPPRKADAAIEREGFALYQDICMGCHGLNAVSGLLIPDLRGSGLLWSAEGWDQVVRQGLLAGRGMADFSAYLSREQSEAIRAYVIQQAWRGKDLQSSAAAAR
jgi:mono/diheme cytochrome c family protein